jgi:hypothetical protein
MYLRSLGDLTEIIQSQKHGLGSDDVETVAPLLPIAEVKGALNRFSAGPGFIVFFASD